MPKSTPSFLVTRKRALLGALAGVLVLGGVVAGPTLAPTALGPSAALAQLAPSPARPASFADMVERVKPAVVAVQVRRDGGPVADTRADPRRGAPDVDPDSPMFRFFREFRDRFGNEDDNSGPQGRPGPQRPGQRFGTGQGSGFFVSDDGFIVTNNHVIANAGQITVVMDDGARLEARLVGADPRTDIAVLKVEARDRRFPFVRFAGQAPRVGDWVVAIGNPFGLGGTVTAGIVSARGRDIGAGPYDDFIQIDAPVNRGNSGGPTFDVDGNVIGINTAIYSPSGGSVGIGFAISASVAEQVVAQLRETGNVTRGWLGVQIQSVNDDIARSLGLQRAEGALVAEPQPNSPAARAGIRAGDLILAVDGQLIRDARDLSRRVAALAPGASARFEVLRSNRRETVNVTLGRLGAEQQASVQTSPRGGDAGRPNDRGVSAALAGLGLDVVAGRGGLVVRNVDPRGAAGRRGFRDGDVIVDVLGEPISSPDELARAVEGARADGRNSVLVRVRNAQGVRFLPLPVDPS